MKTIDLSAAHWEFMRRGGDALTLRSDAFRYAIEGAGVAAWSDNYFDLHPGEAKHVALLHPDAGAPSNLRVRSLVHTQATGDDHLRQQPAPGRRKEGS